MARAPLEWKNLPNEGMPKPIATAYEKYQEAHEALRLSIEKHMAKKLELNLDEQQVVISTRRGIGYAVKKRSAGTGEDTW